MSYTPVDNELSLNIPITVKITTLTNRTLIETSLLVLCLLLYYLIFNPPLLCTSSWRFEFSPNDQNVLKLFVSIYAYMKQINIHGGSIKYILIFVLMG